MSNILVVAAHPDDDVLGAGGTIRQHVLDGDMVHIVYLTSGELGCPDLIGEPGLAAALREEEAGVASQVLQTHRLTFWRLPDRGVTVTSETLRRMRVLLAEDAPALVYAPHPHDNHPDHRAAGKLAWQTVGGSKILRFYEVWTPLAQPSMLVDITAHASAKRNAIRAHRSQVAHNAFDEAILSLNRYRGLLHFPNVLFAEAFGGQP